MSKLELVDRLAELPFRFRKPEGVNAYTWLLTIGELRRIEITWPTTYQWAPGAVMVETLREGLLRMGVLRLRDTPQEHKGVVLLTCRVDDRELRVAVDYSDYHDFINERALGECALYFKCQFRSEGYDDPRIVPGGYMVTNLRYYRYFGAFRRLYNRRPSIDVVGRFGYRFQRELRERAVDLLSREHSIGYVGSGGKVRYSRFLREVASARLGLHLPGNGPFTYRVAEFLGLGTCMIAIEFDTKLHVPLVPGVHYAVIRGDLGDLIDRVQYYLHNEEERLRIAAAGRAFFDSFLHFDQLARYHVRTILDTAEQ